MSWLSDALKFEVAHTKDIFRGIGKDPKRLVLGLDPLTTGFWNAALGREDEPIVNQLGGPTEQQYGRAEDQGINTGPGRTAHGVAGTVAGFYGGQAGGDALSWAAGGTGGSGANLGQYARLAQGAGGQPTPVPSYSTPPINSQPRKAAPMQMPAQASGPSPGQTRPVTGNDARRRAMLAAMLAQILRKR